MLNVLFLGGIADALIKGLIFGLIIGAFMLFCAIVGTFVGNKCSALRIKATTPNPDKMKKCYEKWKRTIAKDKELYEQSNNALSEKLAEGNLKRLKKMLAYDLETNKLTEEQYNELITLI